MPRGTIFIVHCVDTEGPLLEDLSATFQRVEEECGVRLEPTLKNLKKLQKKEFYLNGKEEVIYDFVREDQLDYSCDLDALNNMLDSVMNQVFRNNHRDSFKRGYQFNWFCMDHIGYQTNPRKRLLGYHKIFENYKSKIEQFNSSNDRIYWHYHPTNFRFQGHRFGMSYSFTNFHNDILARRIIDHFWFPAANRPGAHMERVDMNLWLEQWIPFDLANQNMKNNVLLEKHEAVHRIPGRMGDWRGAPHRWGIYNPSFFSAREKGNLKRYIAKCLNINARQGQITENEIEKAFLSAENNYVLLSVTNHDFRNFKKETELIAGMIKNVSIKYPDIKYRWSNPVEAFRAVLGLKHTQPIEFDFEINDRFFRIQSNKPVWGIQPFLALKTKDGNYYHDNLIIDSDQVWTYPLDEHSFLKEELSCVGFAANDDVGNTTVHAYKDLNNNVIPVVKNYNDKDWITG